VNLASGEICLRENGGRTFFRDDDVFDPLTPWAPRTHGLTPQVGDRECAYGDVSIALCQRGKQPFARRRNDDDLWPQLRFADDRQILLELAQRFVGDAFLFDTVEVIERAAEGDEHAQEAPLRQFVVVPLPLLVQIEDFGGGKILKRRGVGGGRRRARGCARGRMIRRAG
jgi:hypothetical protein